MLYSFIETYKVGDEINDLMCIDNTTKPCQLSRGEALAITRSSKIKIKKFLNLKKGNLIRCFYLSKTKTGIYVRPLLVDYAEKILIETKVINISLKSFILVSYTNNRLSKFPLVFIDIN